MTPEQQRIAIAEACGWKNHDHPDVMQFKQGWTMPEKWCMDPKGVLRFNHDRPNYLNDLNAMHEAEKVLAQRTTDVLGSYQLYCQVLLDFFGSGVSYTAAQRAEAFLRTIGKWRGAK
jgi:hypothetical protein